MRLTALTLALLFCGALLAQAPPRLVRDINPGPAGSFSNRGAVAFKGKLYFVAATATSGRELWVSDGTLNGTRIVADINPGSRSSSPGGLTIVGDLLYFAATSRSGGTELYVTDGTRFGTRRVIDLAPGPVSGLDSTYVHTFGVIGNQVLFSGQTGPNNRELYITDGTAAGTRLLLDIQAPFINSFGSFPRDFHSGDNVVYFTADEQEFQRQLYRSDGTPEGTVRITNQGATTFGIFIESMTVRNDSAYFAAFNGGNSVDLFAVSGTAPRPRLLIDFPEPGLQIRTWDGSRNRYAWLGDQMLFAADFGDGADLHSSYGTAASTRNLADNEELPFIPYAPQNFTLRGDELFYTDGTRAGRTELWRTDGTRAGTYALTELYYGSNTIIARPHTLHNHLGTLYFSAERDGNGDPSPTGRELHWTDGRPGFKGLVADIAPGPASSNPRGFVTVGEQLFFFADDGASGTELYVTENVPNLVAVLLGTTNVNCPGGTDGTATVFVTGGTSAVDGTGGRQTREGLSPGTQDLVFSDASGNSDTVTVTIREPVPLRVTNLANTPGMINVDSIRLQIAGGSPPYTVTWSDRPGLNTQVRTGLPGGVYIATITDANGCRVFRAYQLGSELSAELIATENVSCFGERDGEAIIEVRGGTTTTDGTGGPRRITDLPAGDTIIMVVDLNQDTVRVPVTITQPQPLATDNVADGPGIISLENRGGTPPYTVEWSEPDVADGTLFRDGLTAGSYDLRITDANGCRLDTSLTILGVLTAALDSVTNVSCHGAADGIARIRVTGGTTPEDGTEGLREIGNLPAGDTTLVVTDSGGNSVTLPVTIGEPAPLVVRRQPGEVAMGEQGTLTVLVNGGTPPYTYAWADTSATSSVLDLLPGGDYTVTVTDANGCTVSGTYFVRPALVAMITEVVDVSCFGGSDGAVEIDVQGGTTNEDGTNGLRRFEGLPAGDTLLVIRDSRGDSTEVAVLINQPDSLVAGRLAGEAEVADQGDVTVEVSGGTPPYTYTWADTTATDRVLTNLSSGVYSVTVMDANGCTDTLSAVIDRTTSFNAAPLSSIRLYPTLTDSRVHILAPSGAALQRADVFDMRGRRVWSGQMTVEMQRQLTINVHSLPSGTYLVRVRLSDGTYAGGRFVRK